MSAASAVFLSYASQDAEAARRIAEALRAAGVEVWFDQNELVGGDQWDSKIRGQISSCALFVPLISANTQARLEGYFRLEWKLAAQRTHTMADEVTFLMPVLIDGTRDAEAKVPAEFRAVQWTKLPGGEASAAFCARVKKLLNGEAVAGVADAGQVPASTRPAIGGSRRRGLSKWWWIAPIFGMTMALALVLRENRKEPGTPPVAPPSAARQMAAKSRELLAAGRVVNRETLAAADDLAEQALKLDPTDADVLATAAQVDAFMVYRGFDISDGRRSTAAKRAQRALALAPASFEARHAQAVVAGFLGTSPEMLAEAEHLYRQLWQEQPANNVVGQELGRVLQDEDRPADAAAVFLQARQPLDAGWAYFAGGQYQEADRVADRLLAEKRDPLNLVLKANVELFGFGDLAAAQAAVGALTPMELMNDDAAGIALRLAVLQRDAPRILQLLGAFANPFVSISSVNYPRQYWTGYAQLLLGHPEAARSEWRGALQAVQERLKSNAADSESLGWVATLQALLGDKEAAGQALRLYLNYSPVAPGRWDWFQGLTLLHVGGRNDEVLDQLAGELRRPQGHRMLYLFARSCPEFDLLRADPRFEALLRETLPAGMKPSTATAGQPAGVKVDDKSVAVLAFANLSDDKSNEYFSDGISEELLTVLQKIPGLKVSARTSSFSFKGRDVTAQEIGARLGVAHLVEGSVRRAGNQVRITARLSRAATGEQLWSDSYTRDLKDIFAVQTELAQTILAQLQTRLGGAAGRAEIAAQVAAAAKGGTRNAQAHELYLQGKYFLGRASMADCTRATDLLQRAIELDPAFALGWAALSSAGWFRGGYGATRQDYEEGYALARRAADRAIELEPAMAAGWIARFDLQSSTEFDWRGSRESLRRAQALAPDDPDVLFRAAALTYTFGDMPRALELTRQAKALDPVNTQIYIQEAYTLLALRRPAEAQEAFQHVLDLSSNAAWGHAGVGLALVAVGNYAAADESAGRSPLDWSRLYVQAMAQFGLKRRAESDRALAELAGRLGEVAAYQVACAHAFRGEADQAFEWLDRAYRQHDPGLSWSKQDFFLQSLHADPRWDAFMHKLGLADDQLTP